MMCVNELCTHIIFHRLLHGGGHHDATDDGDQQEIEGIHTSGPSGLLNLWAAVTAAGAGCRAAATGQLDKDIKKLTSDEKKENFWDERTRVK